MPRRVLDVGSESIEDGAGFPHMLTRSVVFTAAAFAGTFAYARMREIVDELRTDGPSEAEVERARAYAAGRRVLAFENTNAVARHAANQTVVFGQDIDPDAAIDALDAVTYEQVMDIARGISETLSVACVGPHSLDEFS